MGGLITGGGEYNALVQPEPRECLLEIMESVFFGGVVHKVRSTERHWVPYGPFMRGNYQLLAHGFLLLQQSEQLPDSAPSIILSRVPQTDLKMMLVILQAPVIYKNVYVCSASP